jgi:RHS repeat-associated protein
VTFASHLRGTTTATVGADYDSVGVGRQISATYGGTNFQYRYDRSGRLSSVAGVVSELLYDSRWRLTRMTLENGVYETYSYSVDRISQHQARKGTTTLMDLDYSYDDASRVTRLVSILGGTTSTLGMRYDGLNRLTRVTGGQSLELGYNAIGNITHKSDVGDYVYGNATHKHAVTTAGASTYTYDAAGNMLVGAGRTHTWDVHGRLTRLAVGSTVSTYKYDGSGLRTEQVEGATTTRYFGEAADAINGTVSYNVFVAGKRVARRTGSTHEYFHTDVLSSTRLMTNAAGSVVRTYDYRPHGVVRTTSGTATTNVRYGGYRDDGTGLMYLKARYYDGVLGRFVSADSIVPKGTPQQLNRYSYADNSPYNFNDPSGNNSCPANTPCASNSPAPSAAQTAPAGGPVGGPVSASQGQQSGNGDWLGTLRNIVSSGGNFLNRAATVFYPKYDLKIANAFAAPIISYAGAAIDYWGRDKSAGYSLTMAGVAGYAAKGMTALAEGARPNNTRMGRLFKASLAGFAAWGTLTILGREAGVEAWLNTPIAPNQTAVDVTPGGIIGTGMLLHNAYNIGKGAPAAWRALRNLGSRTLGVGLGATTLIGTTPWSWRQDMQEAQFQAACLRGLCT